MAPQKLAKPPHQGRLSGSEGVDFVRCRICGDHRRVISARHLSKHEIDRGTYMAEYRLSPDQLIAKDFRRIQSSRRGYHPYGKSDWVSSIRRIYKETGSVFAENIQKKHRHVYLQGVWIYGAPLGIHVFGVEIGVIVYMHIAVARF
jgi:hypothetical protein